MPASVKLASEMGGDLSVLFVECGGLSTEEAAAFALKKKWLGNSAMWTSERPFEPAGRGLPAAALLSADGKIVLEGNPVAMESEFEEAIKAEIKRAQAGPKDAPPTLKQAWTDFGKGKYGQALSAARKAAAASGDAGADPAAAAGETVALMEKRVESLLARVDWMMENGHFVAAEGEIARLAAAVKGASDFEEKVKERKAALEAADLKPEIDAAKALAKLEQKFYREGGDPQAVKQLESFAQDHAGTKAAARATQLAGLGTAAD